MSPFDVSLTLRHPIASRTWFALPVIGADLSPQGIQALVGGDVLANRLFIYAGEGANFCLAF
jgi:hypothetical protein